MKSIEPRETGLSRVFLKWMLQLTEPMAPPGAAQKKAPPSAGLPPVQTLEELHAVLVEGTEKWPKQWRQKGIEQGVKQGVERVLVHERALLSRQAALRFGAETASRVSQAVERIARPEELAAAGDWIVRADTGDELVARLMQHHVVDGQPAEDDLPGGNLVTAVVRLEKSGSAPDLIPVLEALRARLSGPRAADLRLAFLDWVLELLERLAPSGEGVPVVRTMDELETKLAERVAEWPKQWLQQGVEQGLAQQRALLRQQAALRFGDEAAARVSETVERIAKPEGLAAAGDWIVRADTGGELAARLTQIAEGRDAA